MNTKLLIEKDLKVIPDINIRFREEQIKRLQIEYGYDRDNAAKLYEYQCYKGK